MAGEPPFPKFLRVAAVPLFKKGSSKANPLSFVKLLDFRLADVLSTALGFSYEVVPAMDGQYGAKIPGTNEVSGAVGLVHKGEADIAVSGLGISDDRLEFINFSYPYFIETFRFVTKKPDFLPKFLTVINPFTKAVWTAIIVCLLVMSVVFYAMLIQLGRRKPFQEVLLKTFGSLLNQDSIFDPVRLSSRILLLSWTLGALFTTLSYAAVFLSFLTLPMRERGIQTIHELSKAVAEGKYHVATYKGNFIPELLGDAEEEYMRVLARDVRKNLVLVSETESTVLKSSTRMALIAPYSYITPMRRQCFISETQFFAIPLSIGYGKNFCCPKAIDAAIFRLTSVGLYKKLIQDQDYRASLKHPEKPVPEVTALTILDLSGPFIFLTIGLVVATVVFMVEVCVGTFSRKS